MSRVVGNDAPVSLWCRWVERTRSPWLASVLVLCSAVGLSLGLHWSQTHWTQRAAELKGRRLLEVSSDWLVIPGLMLLACCAPVGSHGYVVKGAPGAHVHDAVVLAAAEHQRAASGP